MARSDPTNRPRPTTRRGALTWLGASALPRWAHAQSDGTRPHYTVSVVPQFAASELHRDWAPLLERLSQESRLSLTLRVVETISRFEAEFLAGVPDFVYLNPYHQVMARRAHGYVPLVRDGKPLSGILVVRRDSALRSVTELAGKPVAFPSPNAFGASLWIRALLAERDRVTIEPHYAQTHSNVYRQVLLGRVAAGGGVNNTLLQEREEVRTELRVLMETPGVPAHPISAHPRVPVAIQQRLTDAFLRLAADPTTRMLLSEVRLGNPVRADHARDYQPLETYRLERYLVREASSG